MSPVRHIAFVSPLGGTGQTTLVAHLAGLLAQQQPCLALDLCAQNLLGHHLGLAADDVQGWAEPMARGQWWGDAARVNQEQVGLLPFGQASLSGLLALEQRASADTDWLGTQLRELDMDAQTLVLLDAPAWPHPLARQALACADLVVVCLDTSLRAGAVGHHLQTMRARARDGLRMVCAPTRFDPRRDSHQQALLGLVQHWGADLIPYVLHEDEAVPMAWQQRLSVLAHDPQAQIAHDLQGMARWLQEHIQLRNGPAA